VRVPWSIAYNRFRFLLWAASGSLASIVELFRSLKTLA
jgi:hypothetical protein